MLRKSKIRSFYYFIKKWVPKLFFDDSLYGCKGFPIVVFKKMSDIFEEKGFWFFLFENSDNIKKKSSSCLWKTFFKACLRKRLTRKASTENIKIRYRGFYNLRNISSKVTFLEKRWGYIFMIVFIGFPCFLVPFWSKYTLSPDFMKCKMKSPNSCKKINKTNLFFPSPLRPPYSLWCYCNSLLIHKLWL